MALPSRSSCVLATLAACLPAVSHADADEADAHDDTDTKPLVVEANLPAGYPVPGPPGEVTLKTFPPYRLARAKGPNAFGQLFRHITTHDIPMTAPVEMTLAPAPGNDHDDGDAPLRRLDMAFLYHDPGVGEPGPDGSVEVIDMPAITALSYGFFGRPTPDVLHKAVARLHADLADRPNLAPAGPPRLAGYNSPTVPEPRRYYEVQLPVAALPTDEEPDLSPSL
ncbi:MAG: heme-binding protein [Planctomycetota bacterium]